MGKSKIAFAILNRNAPELTNNFVERMKKMLRGYVRKQDFFVLENGSDPSQYSKYANIIEEKSLGVGWGMNKLINHCYDLGYDYVWLNHNDPFLEQPKEFLKWSLDLFNKDQSVGITIPWKDSWVWGLSGNEISRQDNNQYVSFWDHISTIFSRKSIEVTKNFNPNFNPFDSENYGGHYLMLCPSLALYSLGMRVVTNSQYLVEEINLYEEENKEELSNDVRGYGDQEWKKIVGPESIKRWFDKLFPQNTANLSIKQKRNILIAKVCELSRLKKSVK
jgi:hypothetical protein